MGPVRKASVGPAAGRVQPPRAHRQVARAHEQPSRRMDRDVCRKPGPGEPTTRVRRRQVSGIRCRSGGLVVARTAPPLAAHPGRRPYCARASPPKPGRRRSLRASHLVGQYRGDRAPLALGSESAGRSSAHRTLKRIARAPVNSERGFSTNSTVPRTTSARGSCRTSGSPGPCTPTAAQTSSSSPFAA